MKQCLKDRKLLIVTRTFAGRRRKMFELQSQIFGEVKVITKIGESLPEVTFLSGFGNIEQLIRQYQPDVLHINIDFSEPVYKLLDLQYPKAKVLDMYDCSEMRGAPDQHLRDVYQNYPDIPKIFSSEKHLEYITAKYGRQNDNDNDNYYFIPNVPLLSWLPRQRKLKIEGDSLVYFGGIIGEWNDAFCYRYYYDLFKIFIEAGIAVHVYPSQVSKKLQRYIDIGVVFHKTVPMRDLYNELTQYQVGFVGYNDIGENINHTAVDYATKCLPNKAFDYLFAGIPTLAYNLGYAEKFTSRWGICIHDVELLIDAYYAVKEQNININYERWQKMFCLENYKKDLVNIYQGIL